MTVPRTKNSPRIRMEELEWNWQYSHENWGRGGHTENKPLYLSQDAGCTSYNPGGGFTVMKLTSKGQTL